MSVLVYVESRDGELKKAGLEALCAGKKLATDMGGDVCAVYLGDGLDNNIAEIKKYGAAKVFTVKGDDFNRYNADAFMPAVIDAAGQCDAKVVMMASTALGRDLAPRVAAKMNIMILPDAIEIKPDGENVIVRRPVYAGKAHYITKANALPVVITTRPNMFDLVEAEGAGEIVEMSPAYELKARVVDFIAASGEKIDVAEADRIVAGGRGLADDEKFKIVEDLAEVLGAAVGASRAIVDNGQRPHSEQIGQTGKTVAPTLYFAIGISGAIQHLAGMQTSKTIVAINKDADAPIFKTADYGIVGDAQQVVPALIEALKK